VQQNQKSTTVKKNWEKEEEEEENKAKQKTKKLNIAWLGINQADANRKRDEEADSEAYQSKNRNDVFPAPNPPFPHRTSSHGIDFIGEPFGSYTSRKKPNQHTKICIAVDTTNQEIGCGRSLYRDMISLYSYDFYTSKKSLGVGVLPAKIGRPENRLL